MNKICPHCGDTLDSDGTHRKGSELVDMEDFGFQESLKAECAICKSRASYNTIINQYAKNERWGRVFSNGSVICPYCYHQLFPRNE